jgi:uncharacterized protein YuzE
MKELYLEVTFRHGRPVAAYLYLPRRPGEKSHRTAKADPGLLIDFNSDGRPIGIEITAPTMVTAAAINDVLRELGQPAIEHEDLVPLRAA